MSRPPARTFCAKMRGRFLPSLRFQLAKQLGNEVNEYPNARNTPLIWPVENINRRRVPHLPIQEHWHQAAAAHVSKS